MTQPDTISADYTLRPSEVAATLSLLVEARQPAMLWGGPGTAKSMIAQQVATAGNRQYVDVRALLLDPVDLRGIPWRDSDGRTRWAPPVFLPPTDDAGLWLINLEELPSCVPMVQAALYQLALERKVGEYALPEGASLIACGNREGEARRRRADGEVRGLLRGARRTGAGGRVMAARVLEESAQRVSDGVTELLRKQPFFGSLALRLPLRADPSRETLASDGHEIRYSPRWVAATDAHVIETAMARVVMACALKHHTRRGERDPERWQLASQLVTHALIRDAGFTLPPGAEAWDGVSVEEAYDRLPEPQEDDSGGDGEAPPAGGAMAAAAAGQASAAGNDDDDSPDGPADTPDSPANDDDSGTPDDGGGREQDGSGDDGRGDNRRDQDQAGTDGPGPDGDSDAPASHDPSGTGEIMDAGARSDGGDGEGESPVDVTAEEQAWDEAMHQAMNLARAEGKLPGGVEETVRNAHASTLDWRSLLRRYMTRRRAPRL